MTFCLGLCSLIPSGEMTEDRNPPTDPYVIQPVVRALAVLEAIAASPTPLSLKQIVDATGFPKTTAFKHVHTLRKAGFLSQEPGSEKVRLGMKILLIAGSENRLDYLRDVSRPTMERLRDDIGETVNLGALEGTEIVYVSVLASRQSLRTHAREGGRDPAFSTAVGRAILARLPLSECERAIPDQPKALTPKTSVTRRAILSELELTRDRGYAIDDGESESDVRCVGAAILGPGSRVIGGLSVSGPTSRFDEDKFASAKIAILAAADEISSLIMA